jgi:hypothetical protein
MLTKRHGSVRGAFVAGARHAGRNANSTPVIAGT